MTAQARQREMRQLISRGKSIASPLRTVVLAAEPFERDWRDMAYELPPYNVLVNPGSTSSLEAIEHALVAIRSREADSSVILIPADHCAAVELAWVMSAREALGLAARHPDTVYLLHDKPQERLGFDASSDFCSSTVVVGSTQSLLELCHGRRPSHLIEMTTGGPGDTPALQSPIRIVRIQSVEEYARLQRGDYSRPPAVIDVRA